MTDQEILQEAYAGVLHRLFKNFSADKDGGALERFRAGLTLARTRLTSALSEVGGTEPAILKLHRCNETKPA